MSILMWVVSLPGDLIASFCQLVGVVRVSYRLTMTKMTCGSSFKPRHAREQKITSRKNLGPKELTNTSGVH